MDSDRERAGTVLYVALRSIDKPEDDLHALSCRSRRRRSTSCSGTRGRSPARSSFGGRRGRGRARSAHRRLRHVDRDLVAERATRRPGAAEAEAALQEARPRARRARGARADAAARHADGVIDTHAHLDACADRPSALIRRARSAGVDRIVTVGTGIDSSRAALELAELHEEVFAALGIDPHQAGDAEARRVDELRELLRARGGGRGGGDRARLLPRPGSARSAAEALRGPARARGRAREAGRHPHTRRGRGHCRRAQRLRRHRRHALLLVAAPPRHGARARLLRLLRGQRHLSEGERPARRGRPGSRRADPRRDGQPVPRAAGPARTSQRARERRADGRRAGEGSRRGRGRARRPHRRERHSRFSLP